jgi:DNA-binding NarL/FixJ family response regulator
MESLRVFIISDDSLSRAGLAATLPSVEKIAVAGQAQAGDDLPRQAALYQADVLLWDLGWEPDRALAHSEAIRRCDLPVVALLPDNANVAAVWAEGVTGLLHRDSSPQKLAAALQAASHGLVTMEADWAAALPANQPAQPPTLAEPLTPRETEVLQLLAEGLSNKAIARHLGVSDHTVKFHVNAIMGKLAAQSRTEAVVQAARLGLLLL